MKKIALLIVAFGWFGLLAAAARPAAAADTGLVVDCNKIVTVSGRPTVEKVCTLQDFFQQFVILAQFGYSLIAVLAVLMFVYGGWQFLTAAGREEKVAHGRRIISGTVVGLIISLAAYVIINFTVSAITGSTARSLNPFGGIALVFPGRPEEQPFSGTIGEEGSACRTSWDTTCNNQIYCADPGTLPGGPIGTIQAALNDMGCQCGSVDGCYGRLTLGCVRRFQIANILSPTGAYDQATQQKLEPYLNAAASNDASEKAVNINLYGCTRSGLPVNFVSTISGQLPEPPNQYTDIARATMSSQGCCLVRRSVGGTPQPLYCVEGVSQRTCAGLGTENVYAEGQACSEGAETKAVCGLCMNTQTKRCFGGSGKYWCEKIVNPAQSFTAGRCPGDNRCSANCDYGLQITLGS